MTDDIEWLDCTDLNSILQFVAANGSARKLRRFACACCWRIEPMMIDERFRPTVELVEQYADGEITHQKLSAVHRGIKTVAWVDAPWDLDHRSWLMEPSALIFATTSARLNVAEVSRLTESIIDGDAYYRKGAYREDRDKIAAAESGWQRHILRDIFGNYFRSVSVWRKSLKRKVVTLAQEICDTRAFDRLPALADTLEETGCAKPEILAHCRGPGPHVKGCWVIDAILGKE